MLLGFLTEIQLPLSSLSTPLISVFNFVNIFIAATLTSLLSLTSGWLSQAVLVASPPPPSTPPSVFIGYTFLFLCMPCNFLLKIGHFR